MTKIDIVLEATAPVSLRAGRSQEDASTLRYLPGTALRGALAEAHSLLRPKEKEEFRQLFLADVINYGNGYPCAQAAEGMSVGAWPAPATTLTCKRCPAGRDSQAHGLRDTLIPIVLFAQSQYEDDSLLSPLEKCNYIDDGLPACRSRLERYTGFLCKSRSSSEYTACIAETEVRTHVGISRTTGAAQQGVLYSRQMCRSGTLLSARIDASPDLADTLVRLLIEISQEKLLRVGNNRTRGLGVMQLAAQPELTSPPSNDMDLEQRLRRFNEALSNAAQNANQRTIHACYLPILLESDVILRDSLMRYLGLMDEKWLARESEISSAHLVYQSASVQRVSGWNALVGLPKPDEWAIEKGSVFVLSLDTFPGSDQLEKLRRLEREGTGYRRMEGFGRITFAHPFHFEVTI